MLEWTYESNLKISVRHLLTQEKENKYSMHMHIL